MSDLEAPRTDITTKSLKTIFITVDKLESARFLRGYSSASSIEANAAAFLISHATELDQLDQIHNLHALNKPWNMVFQAEGSRRAHQSGTAGLVLARPVYNCPKKTLGL